MPKKQTPPPHKKIIIAVNSLEDALENSLSNNDPNIFYIKTETLGEWVKNNGYGFIYKIFGDRETNMFVTFIYKDGDKEFERENLENKILEFKRLKFLQQIINVKAKRNEQNI